MMTLSIRNHIFQKSFVNINPIAEHGAAMTFDLGVKIESIFAPSLFKK